MYVLVPLCVVAVSYSSAYRRSIDWTNGARPGDWLEITLDIPSHWGAVDIRWFLGAAAPITGGRGEVVGEEGKEMSWNIPTIDFLQAEWRGGDQVTQIMLCQDVTISWLVRLHHYGVKHGHGHECNIWVAQPFWLLAPALFLSVLARLSSAVFIPIICGSTCDVSSALVVGSFVKEFNINETRNCKGRDGLTALQPLRATHPHRLYLVMSTVGIKFIDKVEPKTTNALVVASIPPHHDQTIIGLFVCLLLRLWWWCEGGGRGGVETDLTMELHNDPHETWRKDLMIYNKWKHTNNIKWWNPDKNPKSSSIVLFLSHVNCKPSLAFYHQELHLFSRLGWNQITDVSVEWKKELFLKMCLKLSQTASPQSKLVLTFQLTQLLRHFLIFSASKMIQRVTKVTRMISKYSHVKIRREIWELYMYHYKPVSDPPHYKCKSRRNLFV